MQDSPVLHSWVLIQHVMPRAHMEPHYFSGVPYEDRDALVHMAGLRILCCQQHIGPDHPKCFYSLRGHTAQLDLGWLHRKEGSTASTPSSDCCPSVSLELSKLGTVVRTTLPRHWFTPSVPNNWPSQPYPTLEDPQWCEPVSPQGHLWSRESCC